MRQRLVARFLELARERVERLNNDLVALEQRSDDPELGARLLRELHTIKGEARMTGFQSISDHAHKLEHLLAAAREPGWHPDRAVMERALAGLDQILAIVEEAREPEPAADVPNAPPLVTPSAVLRVSAAKLERQSEHITDLLLAQARDDRALARLQDRVHASTTALQGARDLLRQLRLDRAVDQRRLLGLDQALEGIALLGRQVRDALSDLSDISFDHRSLLAALDDDMRDLRLMPLSQLFAEYPRAIRDLAATQGKDVRVDVRGGNVEVDKQVVDLIAEPLLHILRNAVDHGVEPAAVRAAARKSPQAELILAARQSGQQVEISVTDDGPGLNFEAIRARAVASGLLNADEARGMSPTRLTELIFRPGFTTREGVTELSGRGVGLEVVRGRDGAVGPGGRARGRARAHRHGAGTHPRAELDGLWRALRHHGTHLDRARAGALGDGWPAGLRAPQRVGPRRAHAPRQSITSPPAAPPPTSCGMGTSSPSQTSGSCSAAPPPSVPTSPSRRSLFKRYISAERSR